MRPSGPDPYPSEIISNYFYQYRLKMSQEKNLPLENVL